jgi:transposase
MLRELNVVEQRYRAVLEVLSGIPVIEVAERYGVVRQTVHRWVSRYQAEGIAGLADRSHAPKRHPWQASAQVEALICELRRAHRRWARAVATLIRTVACPVPSTPGTACAAHAGEPPGHRSCPSRCR